MKKGYNGPFMCPHCQDATETMFHLAISCTFAKEVWYYILKSLKIASVDPIFSIEDVILKWCLVGKVSVPILLAWSVWRNINSLIFEGKGNFASLLASKIVGFCSDYADHTYMKRLRNPIYPSFDAYDVVGFFHGASQLDLCGRGFVIKFFASHRIYGLFGGGEGTNTRAKIMAR